MSEEPPPLDDLIDWIDRQLANNRAKLAVRKLRAIRERLAGSSGALEWRDISTAPRDGTAILAAVIGLSSLTIVYWDEKTSAWWTFSDIEANQRFDADFFTHWQQLPTPPASP